MGGLRLRLQKPVSTGALPNGIFGNCSNHEAPWSLWNHAHLSRLGEVELGNGGSVRLRAAAPHPFPALPLGGAVGAAAGARFGGGRLQREATVEGRAASMGRRWPAVAMERRWLQDAACGVSGRRPQAGAKGRGRGEGPGRRCDDAADDCSCGWGGGSVRRGSEGGSLQPGGGEMGLRRPASWGRRSRGVRSNMR